MFELTADDIAILRGALTALGVIDASAFEALVRLLRVRELAPGDYLLRAGDLASEVAVLVSGLLREHFVTSSGVERTKNFVCPGHWTGSLPDLLADRPARAFIVAERRSRLLVAPYRQTRALELTFPAFGKLAQRFAEQLLLRKAEREYQLLCLDAAQRYAVFLREYGQLEQLVSLRHVASYLGITPVHLSRLRRRRANAS